MLYMYRLVRYMYISFDVYDCGKCTNTAALEIAFHGDTADARIYVERGCSTLGLLVALLWLCSSVWKGHTTADTPDTHTLVARHAPAGSGAAR